MHKDEQEFSLKNLFVPLTTLKSIHVIIIVGFIVFFNALFNDFVWDDKTYILFNPEINNFNILQTFSSNSFNTSGYYRPIPALFFTILHNLFGPNALFYHFIQIILHVINACLLFFLFKKFISKTSSFFLSLIFLVHPIQVESVAFISASQSELFFLFGILAFLTSLKNTISIKQIMLVFFFSLLSIITKETGFLFIFLIICFQVIFKKKRIVAFLITEFTVLIIYFLLRLAVAGVFFGKYDFSPISRLSFAQRIINIPEVIFYYIKTIFFPMKLAIDQQWVITRVSIQNFYLPLFLDSIFLISSCIVGFYIYRYKKQYFRHYLFFFMWFTVGLLLLLQVFPLDMTVADRWFYFPIVGLLGMFGVSIQSIQPLNKYFKTSSYIIAITLLVILSIRTIIRNANFYDDITLYTHDSQVQDNYEIEQNLGVNLYLKGDINGALNHLTKSVTLFPYENNLYNIGYIHEQANDIPRAREYYEKALAYPHYSNINHKHAEKTYVSLAYILLFTEKPEKTELFIKESLNDYPNSSYLWMYLAVIEYKLQRQEEALVVVKKAKTLDPNNQQINYVYNQIVNNQQIEFKK